ncbi:MAG: hypothetical protein ACXWR1_16195 [Bdellovibrionota bacterium]
MKNVSKVILTAALLCSSSLAHAVTVSECPKQLSIKIGNLSVISAQKLRGMLSVNDNEDGSIEAFRQSLEKLRDLDITARRETANGARCQYSVMSSSVGTDHNNEVMLASSHGKDWLRIRLNTDKGIIGGYITVTGYDPNGVETDGKAMLGYDDPSHPGNLEPSGIAFSNSVDVR